MAPSFVTGPTHPPLWNKTLGSLLTAQAKQYSSKDAVVVPWQNVRASYSDLEAASRKVAIALLAAGLNHGDTVGIVAGNRIEYIEIVLGAARVGVVSVVLNNMYSPVELGAAVKQAGAFGAFLSTFSLRWRGRETVSRRMHD